MDKGLTSFRAFCFFAVFLFHTGYFEAGYLGVQAFFVLSGFLITPALVSSKSNTKLKDYLFNFYARRALRIFPLYYGYLLLISLISLAFTYLLHQINVDQFRIFFSQLPWAATYSYNFFHASQLFEHTNLLTHLWSLSVEEQFYIIFPFIIFFTSPKNINKVLVLLTVLGPAFRLATIYLAKCDPLNLINDREDLVVYLATFSHIDAFAIGGYFALNKIRVNKAPIAILPLITIVIAAGYATQYFLTGNILISTLGYPSFMSGNTTFGYSIINFTFAYLLIHIENKNLMPALFNNPTMVYMGTISYGLYVFHFPILLIVYSYFSGIFAFLLSLFISIVVSTLSYECFERYFLLKKPTLTSNKIDNQPTQKRF